MKRIKFIYPRIIKPVTGGHRYEKSLRDTLCKSDIKVETLSNTQTDGKLSKLTKVLSPFKALRFLKGIDYNNDVVVFNSTTGLYFILLSYILKLHKVPTVIIHHHYLFKEFTGIKKSIYHIVENLFLKSATHIITPSPYIKELINEEIHKKSILLPIPFESPKYDFGNTTNIGQLLYIGTIEQRKGLHLLFEALSQTSDPKAYTLHIVGKIKDTKYKENLDSLIRNYNLHVIFHGFLSDDELNEIKQKSDVFVFPSLLEGFGMAINEVKFFGLPVICFNNSAMPFSTTDGEDGYVVTNKDTREFSKAIEKIVGNRSLRDQLSKNAMDKSRNLYNIENFKKDSVSLFSNF